MKQHFNAKQQSCFCGTGKNYANCCGRFIDGDALPDTAEQLMRSRYTAYVNNNFDYLLHTWHPTSRPATLTLDAPTTWLGLQIKQYQLQSQNHATVEFVARYRVAGKGHRLHEISRFERVAGQWLYVDGSFDQEKSSLALKIPADE